MDNRAMDIHKTEKWSEKMVKSGKEKEEQPFTRVRCIVCGMTVKRKALFQPRKIAMWMYEIGGKVGGSGKRGRGKAPGYVKWCPVEDMNELDKLRVLWLRYLIARIRSLKLDYGNVRDKAGMELYAFCKEVLECFGVPVGRREMYRVPGEVETYGVVESHYNPMKRTSHKRIKSRAEVEGIGEVEV